jgi:hypothetical protein
VRTDATPRRRTGRILATAAASVALAGAVLFATDTGRSLLTGSPSPAALRDRPSFVTGPASASPPVTTRSRVQGPSLVDPLARPGQWRQTRPADNADGWCAFDDKRMTATSNLSSVYSCPGPTDTFAGDQTIKVDATVVTPGACAAIWFRVVERSGYQASFCEKEIRLGLNNEDEVTGEQKAASTAFRPGQTHQVTITVGNETARVTVDGAAVLSLPLTDPLLAGGHVELGTINDVNSGDSSAAFANVELRSPAVGSSAPFPDLLGNGHVSSVVKLFSYDPAAHVVVVEPVLYLAGPDYCKLFKIKPNDGQCEQETTLTESHLRLTIPTRTQPTLTTYDNAEGDGACVGTMISGGVCPAGPTAFAKWAKANPQGLVAVTTTDGVVTKLAEMYSP